MGYGDFYRELNRYERTKMPERAEETVDFVLSGTGLPGILVEVGQRRFGLSPFKEPQDIKDIGIKMDIRNVPDYLENLMFSCTRPERRQILEEGIASFRERCVDSESALEFKKGWQETCAEISRLEKRLEKLKKKKQAVADSYKKAHNLNHATVENIGKGMLDMEKKCCGNCVYNIMEEDDDEPVCNNMESGAYKKPMCDDETCKFWD